MSRWTMRYEYRFVWDNVFPSETVSGKIRRYADGQVMDSRIGDVIHERVT